MCKDFIEKLEEWLEQHKPKEENNFSFKRYVVVEKEDPQSEKQGHWEECEICLHFGRYQFQRKAQDGAPLISRPFELHEAFSTAGFGGIQFEGGDCWLKQFPDQYADEKPLPPRAVRFWVEA